jgi:hypothetical protein
MSTPLSTDERAASVIDGKHRRLRFRLGRRRSVTPGVAWTTGSKSSRTIRSSFTSNRLVVARAGLDARRHHPRCQNAARSWGGLKRSGSRLREVRFTDYLGN